MTKMARLQGETFPLSSINANWMPDFCSTPRGLRVLCAERTGVSSSSSHISWSAMERELDEGDFCEDALVGTILREPLGALQSVLSHDQFDRKAILETLRNCHEAVPAKHFMYQPPADFILNASKCLPEWDTYHHFDNFATRTLGGAYMAPPCGIVNLTALLGLMGFIATVCCYASLTPVQGSAEPVVVKRPHKSVQNLLKWQCSQSDRVWVRSLGPYGPVSGPRAIGPSLIRTGLWQNRIKHEPEITIHE